MDSLFDKFFKPGCQVKMAIFVGEPDVSGRLLGRDDDFVYYQSEDGALNAIHRSSVRKYTLVPEGTPAAADGALLNETPSPQVTGTHSEEAEKMAEPQAQDNAENDKEENESPLGKIFRPEGDEAPKVRIVGKIDLSDFPQKKIFQRPAHQPEEVRPEGIEELLAFTPEGIGYVKSIGPIFGYVHSDGGYDVFFRTNSLLDRLRIGDRVLYTEIKGDKGPMAVSAQPVAPVHVLLRRFFREAGSLGGQRNADNVHKQLLEAVENKEALEYVLNHPEVIQEFVKTQPRRQFVNYAAREKMLADQLLPAKYKEYMKGVVAMLDQLEEKCDESTKKYLHHVYTRAIKNARPEDSERLRERAVEFYTKRGEQRNADFFGRKGQGVKSEFAAEVRKRLNALRTSGALDPYTFDVLRHFNEFEGLDPKKILAGEITIDDAKALREQLLGNKGKHTEGMWLTLIKASLGIDSEYDPKEDIFHYYRMRTERAVKEHESAEKRLFLHTRLIQNLSEEKWMSDGPAQAALAVMTLAGLDCDEVLGAMKQAPSSESIFRRLNADFMPDLYLRLARLASISPRMRTYINYNLEQVGMEPLADIQLPEYEGHEYWVSPETEVDEVCGRFEKYLNEVCADDEALLNLEKAVSSKLLQNGIKEIRLTDTTARDEDDRDAGYRRVKDFLKEMFELIEARPTDTGYLVIRPIILGLQSALRHDQMRRDKAREQYRVR